MKIFPDVRHYVYWNISKLPITLDVFGGCRREIILSDRKACSAVLIHRNLKIIDLSLEWTSATKHLIQRILTPQNRDIFNKLSLFLKVEKKFNYEIFYIEKL